MDDEGGLYNNSQDDDSEAVSKDRLRQSEGSSGQHQPGKDSLDKQGLYKAEKAKSNLLLAAAAGSTPWGRAIRFVGKHKKGAAAGGGGVTGLIIGVVMMFGFIASHELQTIANDLLRYEDKSFSYVVKKAANKIMQKMACRTSVTSISGCSKSNTDEAAGGEDPADPMTSEIDSFSFTDPNVVNGLANQNIKVETTDGKFSGLTDLNTGEAIDASALDNPDMISRFQNAIPEWDVGQESTFRTLMTDDASATFDVIPSPTDENTNKDVEASMAGDVSAEELAAAAAEDTNTSSSSQNGTSTSQTQALDQQLTDSNNEILKTVDQGIASGETEAQIASNIDKNIGTAGMASMVVGDVCSIDNAATQASVSRVPKLIGFLVRHSTTLISLADEMKVGGSMTGTQISKVTSLFNGNPSANPNSKNSMIAESVLPFNRSAAWQRIEGNLPNSNSSSSGFNPDISKAALPIPIAGQQVVSNVNRILSVFMGGSIGKAIICKGATNSIVSGLLGIGQVALGGFSFGLTQVLIGGATIGLQEVLQHQVVPQIVKYFTPIAVDGLENSVQWMNNADAGANLASNMFAQRLGGSPLSGASVATLNSEGANLQSISQSQQSFFARTFSFTNPDSLFSRLIVNLPLSRLGMISSVFKTIIDAPIYLFHDLGSLISGPKVFAATQATNPGQPYDIVQYGFNDSEINKYDPINNEHYLLHTTITYVDRNKVAHTGILINLLGNPNDFPRANPDPSTNDIFHCFAPTKPVLVGFENETGPDLYCGTMGNLNSTMKSVPIGVSQIALSFCNQLAPSHPRCIGKMEQTLSSGYPDLIGHFRQYVLDDEITGYYTSLMKIK